MSKNTASDLKDATDYIVAKQLKQIYDTDKLGWEVISMSLSRTKRFSFTSSHNKAGFIWFVIYDLLGAVEQDLVNNPELIVTLINSLAEYEKVNFGEILSLYQQCTNEISAVDAFSKIFSIVNKEGDELQDISKDTEIALNFIGSKIAERSLISQILTQKL